MAHASAHALPASQQAHTRAAAKIAATRSRHRHRKKANRTSMPLIAVRPGSGGAPRTHSGMQVSHSVSVMHSMPSVSLQTTTPLVVSESGAAAAPAAAAPPRPAARRRRRAACGRRARARAPEVRTHRRSSAGQHQKCRVTCRAFTQSSAPPHRLHLGAALVIRLAHEHGRRSHLARQHDVVVKVQPRGAEGAARHRCNRQHETSAHACAGMLARHATHLPRPPARRRAQAACRGNCRQPQQQIDPPSASAASQWGHGRC